jgi:hypothetical protein
MCVQGTAADSAKFVGDRHINISVGMPFGAKFVVDVMDAHQEGRANLSLVRAISKPF